jgi:AcrR family transcriptional regulator
MSNGKRPYRMKRRAELEAETRRRITESAVALHAELGPARTSISAVAEHAGVRRSTVYRHFPDELSLFHACTSHWMAANPMPDLDAWAAIQDPDARLERALVGLYRHYRSTEAMMSRVLRDESLSATVGEMLAGYRRYLVAARDTLMRGRSARGRARRRVAAAIGHALAFATWRSLAVEQDLTDAEAAALVRRLVAAAAAPLAGPGASGVKRRATSLRSSAPGGDEDSRS